VNRFFKLKRSKSGFREFILKTARSLVESNTQQRRRADVAFGSINTMNKKPHEFFRFAANYIRLWNYDWQDEREHLIDVFSSSASEVDDFCHTEETIFKSCGIPIRFKATLSSAFPQLGDGFFSKRTYTKLTVNKVEEFNGENMKDFLKTRESLFRVFKESDRLRIFRSLPAKPEDILNEWKILITSYNFPLMCYDFARRKEDLTLDYFMK